MDAPLILAASGGPAALLFLLSLPRAARERYEAPFVILSLLLLGRLCTELAAALLLPGGRPWLSPLPNEAIPCIVSWPLAAGLIRFTAASYPAGTEGRPSWKALLGAAIPLALLDALRCLAAALPGLSPVSAVRDALGDLPLGLLSGGLPALALTALALAFLLPRRVKA